MKLKSKILTGLMLLSGAGISVNAQAAACPGTLTLPVANLGNTVSFGDALVYSLPVLGLDVPSTPGHIQDCIVIGTGANGAPVNENSPDPTKSGIDNAYQIPGNSTFFRTGDPGWSPDPDINKKGPWKAEFTGDQISTWDITAAALKGFLAGNDMVVYFNHNQTNSGSSIDQNIAIWAQIRLWDGTSSDPDSGQFFYVTSTFGLPGLPNFGLAGDQTGFYTGPQQAADCTYPTGADSPCSFPSGDLLTTGLAPLGSARYMVDAQGKICLNGPVGVGTPVPCSGPHVAEVNENLGADHVANAIVFPEINTLLAAGFNGVISVDLRMGCNSAVRTAGTCPAGFEMNNGYEQVFIARLEPERCVGEGCAGVPEPGILALLGLGLFAAGLGRIRRRKI
jgi:hypothetical protein